MSVTGPEAAEIGKAELAPIPKPGRSLSVGAKISAVVVLCLVALSGVSTMAITQMQKINTEIEGIAERDIPLTEITSQITVHQLEQAIAFERAARYAEEMHSHAAARPKFESTVHAFEKLSNKVNNEIKAGESLAQHAIDTAKSPEAQKEFAHVLTALETIEHHHASYEKHAVEALLLFKADKTVAAIDTVEKSRQRKQIPITNSKPLSMKSSNSRPMPHTRQRNMKNLRSS